MVVSLLEYVGYGRHVQRCYIFAVDGVSQAVNFKAVYLEEAIRYLDDFCLLYDTKNEEFKLKYLTF